MKCCDFDRRNILASRRRQILFRPSLQVCRLPFERSNGTFVGSRGLHIRALHLHVSVAWHSDLKFLVERDFVTRKAIRKPELAWIKWRGDPAAIFVLNNVADF